jgi:hypothetical protein
MQVNKIIKNQNANLKNQNENVKCKKKPFYKAQSEKRKA